MKAEYITHQNSEKTEIKIMIYILVANSPITSQYMEVGTFCKWKVTNLIELRNENRLVIREMRINNVF